MDLCFTCTWVHAYGYKRWALWELCLTSRVSAKVAAPPYIPAISTGCHHHLLFSIIASVEAWSGLSLWFGFAICLRAKKVNIFSLPHWLFGSFLGKRVFRSIAFFSNWTIYHFFLLFPLSCLTHSRDETMHSWCLVDLFFLLLLVLLMSYLKNHHLIQRQEGLFL